MLSTDFHVPEIEIVTREIPLSVNAKTLTLRVRARDSRTRSSASTLRERCARLRHARFRPARKNARTHEQDIELPLLPGRQQDPVVGSHQQGTESLKQTVYTTRARNTRPPRSTSSQSRQRVPGQKLQPALRSKDAADLVAATSGGNPAERLGQSASLVLTDRNATRAEILKAKDWLKQAKVNDLVVVFAAGHGMTDDQSNYYSGRTISIPGIRRRAAALRRVRVPARRRSGDAEALLLDTLLLGEIEKDQPVAVAAGPAARRVAGTVRMRAFKSARAVSVVADEAGRTRRIPALRGDAQVPAGLVRGSAPRHRRGGDLELERQTSTASKASNGAMASSPTRCCKVSEPHGGCQQGSCHHRE